MSLGKKIWNTNLQIERILSCCSQLQTRRISRLPANLLRRVVHYCVASGAAQKTNCDDKICAWFLLCAYGKSSAGSSWCLDQHLLAAQPVGTVYLSSRVGGKPEPHLFSTFYSLSREGWQGRKTIIPQKSIFSLSQKGLSGHEGSRIKTTSSSVNRHVSIEIWRSRLVLYLFIIWYNIKGTHRFICDFFLLLEDDKWGFKSS